MNIRTRLLASMVGSILIFALVVVATFWFGWQRSIRTVAEALTGERLERTESDLNAFAEPIEDQLLEAVSWGRDGLLSLDEIEEGEDLLQSFMREYPWMTSAVVADTRGRTFGILQDDINWTSRLTRPEEWGQEARFAEWSDDAPEKITYREPLDYNPRQEDWFLGAIDQRNAVLESVGEQDDRDLIYWAEPRLLGTNQRPGLVAAAAFRSAAGMDHVVAFEVRLMEIHAFTSSIGADDDTRAFVMTDDLRLLGLPRSDDVMTDAAVEELLLREPSEVNNPLVDDATNALISRVDTETAFEFVSAEQTWWGEAQAFTLPGSEQSLLMMVLVPEHSLTGQMRQQLVLTLLVTLAITVVVVLWAVRTSRLISEPFENLALKGEQLSRGDLDADLDVRSPLSEVNRLSAALAKMRDSLTALFQVERKLQTEKEYAVVQVEQASDFDIAGWSESADPDHSETRHQAVPHQMASVWDHFSPDGGNQTVLLLADAIGEGLESVFLATQGRSMIRMATQLDPDVGTVAAALNEQLHDDLPEGHFLSAWLGSLESGSSTLTGVSAGVQTVFHYRADGDQCETIRSESMPFGVFEGKEAHPPTKIDLAPGDVFAVASDGVLNLGGNEESSGSGNELIARTLRERHTDPAMKIVEALTEAISQATSSAPLRIDCSLIVIKRV